MKFYAAAVPQVLLNSVGYVRGMAGGLGNDGHCANLMNPGYTELSVGKGGLYWVQVFARPQ